MSNVVHAVKGWVDEIDASYRGMTYKVIVEDPYPHELHVQIPSNDSADELMTRCEHVTGNVAIHFVTIRGVNYTLPEYVRKKIDGMTTEDRLTIVGTVMDWLES